MASNNIGKTEVSRIFIEFKKNRPWILTDFGASLQSLAGPEGEHSLVELDSSGLAWEAGFRNDDVIEAVDVTSLKVKGISHRSLLEYLREEGQACNMLIRRDRKDKPSIYTWVAFLIKQEIRGDKPVVAKKAKRRVGTDIDDADDVYKTLPKWALNQTPTSISAYAYNKTQEIRLVDGEGDEKDNILGFFIQLLGVSRASFTTKDFVLNMHSYENIHSPSDGLVFAFSAKLQKMNSKRTSSMSSCFDLICRKTNDVDNDDDNDGNDDTNCDERNDESNDDNESCISGNERGPLNLTDFPSYMTGGQPIIGNSKMFLWKTNSDGSGFLSPINTEKELYMCNSHDVDSRAGLRVRKYMLYIRPINT